MHVARTTKPVARIELESTMRENMGSRIDAIAELGLQGIWNDHLTKVVEFAL